MVLSNPLPPCGDPLINEDGDARRAFLKRSTARAFAVAFVALSQNNMIGDDVLFLNWYLIEVKKTHASSTNSIYLLVASFKISDKNRCPFYMRVPTDQT